jgi:hypothetical protein
MDSTSTLELNSGMCCPLTCHEGYRVGSRPRRVDHRWHCRRRCSLKEQLQIFFLKTELELGVEFYYYKSESDGS